MIDEKLWNQRMQDKGSMKNQLPKITYKISRIMVLGTKEMPVCYYYLTAISINLAQKMEKEKTTGHRWNKLPDNKTDIKVKIVERLLATRKIINEQYILNQCRIIGILSNIWGSIKLAALIHHNDWV